MQATQLHRRAFVCLLLVAGFTARILGQTPAAPAPPSATKPVPREGRPYERFQQLNERVKQSQGNVDLVFIGDSITQGWEGAGKEVWQKYYGHRKSLNLGIGGDQTQHVLWRLDNGNADGLKPKVAVLMIGTNNSGDDRNTASEMLEGVTAVVQKIRDKMPGTKILLLAIFPRGAHFNNQRGKILQVNQALRKLDDGNTVHYLDIGHRFLGADGTLPKEIMPDFLHLSPKGYAIWAAAIEAKLAALLGDQAVAPDPGAAASSVNVSGDWIWMMESPSGPVEGALVLKQDAGRITGRFARDATRWLDLEDGRISGNELTWTIKRDRPDGSTMTYRMSGKVEGARIAGKATTQMDGNEVTSEWTAKRK